MANRKPDLDAPCAGCGTPLNFLRGEPRKVVGKLYHPNCVPSHSPSQDAEYYAGIRDGYQRHLNKQQFGEDYADAADTAREMRREGYSWPDPPLPAGKAQRASQESESWKPNPSPNALHPKISGYDLKTADGCRAAYRAARKYVVKNSYAGSAAFPTNADFDARVKADMEKAGVTEPTPRDWVKYAHRVTFPCGRCGGTGRFITMVENGQPKGPGGQCFRCQGKGHQNARDAHRNFWHDMHYVPRGY